MTDASQSPLAALYGRMTAGPWEVVRYDGGSLVIHSGPDLRVCFMATPGESPDEPAQIKANAAGIVAAHRLLSAVAEPAELRERMARVIEPEAFTGRGSILSQAQLARQNAALAKADALIRLMAGVAMGEQK